MTINYQEEWNKILCMGNSRPYVFRTRLERLLLLTKNYSISMKKEGLTKLCDKVFNMLQYLSDQSNQNSSGELKSYNVLLDYLIEIRSAV
jgi:hypothetical protein